MSDLFHEILPESFIRAVFEVMASAREHTFIVLTKRAARMREVVAALKNQKPTRRLTDFMRFTNLPIEFYRALQSDKSDAWPLPNVWLGVSVEDQPRWDEREPALRATPAAVRVVSLEPLLGRIDIDSAIGGSDGTGFGGYGFRSAVDWVIVGGESGHGARPCAIEWVRHIVRRCRKEYVPCFVKQLGRYPYVRPPGLTDVTVTSEWPVYTHFGNLKGTRLDGQCVLLEDPKGGDPDEWPEELRVREWPKGEAV